MTTTADQERFNTLLPFYVNGSLPSDERAWMQAYLQRTPAAAQALNDCRQLADAVKADMQSRVDALARDIGLARLLLRVRDEPVQRRNSPAPISPRKAPAPLRERAAQWLQRLWSPQTAVACAVIALQFGTIVHLAQQMPAERSDTALLRSAPASGASDGAPHAGPFVRVLFRDGVTEQQLRALLLAERLHVLAGPNQYGEYWLAPLSAVSTVSAAADTAQLLQRLQDDARIASAVLDPELPQH